MSGSRHVVGGYTALSSDNIGTNQLACFSDKREIITCSLRCAESSENRR